MNNFNTMPLRFRVWDRELERFVRYKDIYGDCVNPNDIDFDIEGIAHLWNKSYDIWQNYIISQNTGLKDKNGKSIWTGDIVHFKPYERNATVLYKDGMVIVRLGQKENYYIGAHLDYIEVTGNIWQAPELLEGESQHDDS